jgi:hypothetical protein
MQHYEPSLQLRQPALDIAMAPRVPINLRSAIFFWRSAIFSSSSSTVMCRRLRIILGRSDLRRVAGVKGADLSGGSTFK